MDLFLACSQRQVDFLREHLGLPSDRVRLVWDHTDTRFFSPGPARRGPRPVIASVGLEQRDYRTLAAATHDLDVDVRISGSSQRCGDAGPHLPRSHAGQHDAAVLFLAGICGSCTGMPPSWSSAPARTAMPRASSR